MSLLRRLRRLTRAWRTWAEAFDEEREDSGEFDGFGPSASAAWRAWTDFLCFGHCDEPELWADESSGGDPERTRAKVYWSDIDRLDEDESPPAGGKRPRVAGEDGAPSVPVFRAFCEAMRAGLRADRVWEAGEYGEYDGTISQTLRAWERLESVLEGDSPTAHLVERLSHEDPGVHRRAAGEFADIGARAGEAIPALVGELCRRKDHRPARDALGKMGVGAVGVVSRILRAEPDGTACQRRAVEALERIGPMAVQTLVETLQHRDERVASLAGEALGRLYSRVGRGRRRRLVWSLARTGPHAVPALLRALEDDDEDARLGALDVVATMGARGRLDATACEAVSGGLARLLQEGDTSWYAWYARPRERVDAVGALKELGRAGRRVLIARARLELRCPEKWQCECMAALGDVPTWAEFSDAEDVFESALSKGAPGARAVAVECLGRFTENTDALLVRVVLDPTVERDARHAALSLLEGTGREVDALVAGLEHDEASIRSFAIAALAGGREVDALVAGLDHREASIRSFAIGALAKVRWGGEAEAAVPAVAQRLEHDENPGVRVGAAALLGDIAHLVGDAARRLASALAVAATGDAEARVRRAATMALAKCSIELGLPTLGHALGDEDPAVMTEAVLGLASLVRHLDEPEFHPAAEFQAWTEAFQRARPALDEPSAMRVLTQATESASPEVREAAALVLEQLQLLTDRDR